MPASATIVASVILAALIPANAVAETVALSCALGEDAMTIAYHGDGETGGLTVQSAWGQMSFPYAEYTAGEAPGDYEIVGNAPQTIIMPDLAALEACLTSRSSEYDLQFLDVVSPLVEECRVKVPDSKQAMDVNVEINVALVAGVPDVYIVRTYAAESPVSGGHIDIVSLPQPRCTVRR